jgi:hypothetical protein
MASMSATDGDRQTWTNGHRRESLGADVALTANIGSQLRGQARRPMQQPRAPLPQSNLEENRTVVLR